MSLRGWMGDRLIGGSLRLRPRSVVDEISQLLDHEVYFGFVVFKVLGGVNYKDLFGVVLFEPVFVFEVDLFQVLEWDLVLLGTHPLFGALETLLGSAPQINYFGFFLGSHRLETRVQALKHLVLALVHVAVVLHQLRKYVLVSQNAPLRNLQLVRVSFHRLLQLFYSGEYCIYLECESPSFGLCVVFLQHVDLFSA